MFGVIVINAVPVVLLIGIALLRIRKKPD